jgi:hypothetical protein
MKYSVIVLILMLASGCATTSIPERPRAIALKKLEQLIQLLQRLKMLKGMFVFATTLMNRVIQ